MASLSPGVTDQGSPTNGTESAEDAEIVRQQIIYEAASIPACLSDLNPSIVLGQSGLGLRNPGSGSSGVALVGSKSLLNQASLICFHMSVSD